jgi:hypothetical protein
VALAAVDRLGDKLAGYHAYHATRADVLRRLGCGQKSRAAYDKAIELAGNTAETAYLTRRRDQLGSARAKRRPAPTEYAARGRRRSGRPSLPAPALRIPVQDQTVWRGQDVVGGPDPDEGLAVVVPVIEEALDGLG